MEHYEVFGRFGIALLVGALIGLEREYSRLREEGHAFAGIRTFPLIALLGCAAALIADEAGTWGFGLVLLVVAVMVIVAYAIQALRGQVGMTSEVAAIVVFVCGALAYWDYLVLSAALGVITLGFLTLKPQLHGLAQRVSSEDLYATLKFAIISLIVLPILPNQDYGPPPFDAFNPYRTWLMVVFISGISFLGYILIQVVGQRRGIGLSGLLGGLASSTATTLTFSERSDEHPELARPLALGITLAWTVMFGRVIIEVAVLNQSLLQVLWLPMAAGMAAGLVFCAYYYFSQRTAEESEVKLSNPFELGTAIKFGLLYAVVLVVAKAAQFYFQDAGLYVASVLAGLTDVDAITLSMAELSQAQGSVGIPTASVAVVLAVISNTVVKGAIAFAVGSKTLRRALLPPFVAMLVVAALVAFLAI
jgi:uncharacterized membrane protein (DUF4010 family)